MPTIVGLRRRGVTPESIRDFCEKIGVARTNSRVEISLLESCIRDDLNTRAPRVMCVLRPLKVVLTNYPADEVEELDAAYWPHDVPKEGSRPAPFARELYIERDDFMENPPKDFIRLAPGREVRLRYGYIIQCNEVVKDPQTGEILELRCTYDPASRGGATADGRKVRGTIHWVSANHAIPVEVRLYEQLFSVPDPENTAEGQSFIEFLNPNSLEVLRDARAEPGLANAEAGARYQFERQGYFVADTVDSRPGALVFNRIVALRDSWAGKTAQAGATPKQAKAGKAATLTMTDIKRERGEPAPVTGARSEARDQARAANPALAERLSHYVAVLGLPEEQADVLTGDPAVADFFEAAVGEYHNPKLVANWVVNEVLRVLKENTIDTLRFSGAQLGALVTLVGTDTITGASAKEVFAEMLQTGDDPRGIVERRGLKQVADPTALAPVIDRIIAANGDKAAQYRAGKNGLLGFFVGQVMKETGGKANPQLVQGLVRERLGQDDKVTR
jgi:glutaminyl-tRNA synthetase